MEIEDTQQAYLENYLYWICLIFKKKSIVTLTLRFLVGCHRHQGIVGQTGDYYYTLNALMTIKSLSKDSMSFGLMISYNTRQLSESFPDKRVAGILNFNLLRHVDDKYPSMFYRISFYVKCENCFVCSQDSRKIRWSIISCQKWKSQQGPNIPNNIVYCVYLNTLLLKLALSLIKMSRNGHLWKPKQVNVWLNLNISQG